MVERSSPTDLFLVIYQWPIADSADSQFDWPLMPQTQDWAFMDSELVAHRG
jgi:hypothetical protein